MNQPVTQDQRDAFEKFAATTGDFGTLEEIRAKRAGEYYMGVALRIAWKYWKAGAAPSSR